MFMLDGDESDAVFMGLPVLILGLIIGSPFLFCGLLLILIWIDQIFFALTGIETGITQRISEMEM